MKPTILFGMMCAFGACTAPALAVPVEAADASSISGFSVSFSGGGWGAAAKASLALKSLEGVDKVLLSGTTAFVTVKGEATLSRTAIRKAFDPKGLKVKGLKKASIAKPKEAYQLAITGGTWAQTNERVRGTLEKLDGVGAAFVNRGQVTLLMSAEETYNEEEIAKILKRYKSTVKSSSKVASPL